ADHRDPHSFPTRRSSDLMSSLEMGTLMLRHVMLERALDMSVRDLRLGNWNNPTHDDFKRVVCNRAGVIPDCMNVLLVELRPVSTDRKSHTSELQSRENLV